MRSRLYVTLGTLASLAVLAVLATGCGSDSGGGSTGGTVSGSSLTIYSSLPLQGTSRGQSEAVIAGEKLALKQLAPGNKIGKYSIKYVSLDDSTAQNPGTADEGQTAQNARKAVQDKTTIVYLGEFNSGGTKVSLPILNQAGIPQVSPSNTYVGLTTDDPGSEPGEPQKYYPAQTRTYARVVPRDTIQGAALVSIMKSDGCKAVTLWDDKSTYGAGLARNVELSAKQGGLPIEDRQGTDKTAPNYRSLAANVKTDCFRGPASPARTACRCSRTSRPLRRCEALRAGRRSRGGVHQPEEGRHPGERRGAHAGHRRDARRQGPAQRSRGDRRLQEAEREAQPLIRTRSTGTRRWRWR